MTILEARRSTGTLVEVGFALVLTAIVAASLWWGYLRENAPMGTGIRVQADFTGMPNGPAPAHFEDGRPATVLASSGQPGDQFRISDGQLTYQPTTQGTAVAYFSTPDLGASVKSMGARFTFRAGPGPKSGTQSAITFVVSRGIDQRVPPMVRPLPVNLVVTPVNWYVSMVRTDADNPEVIAAGEFKTPMREDGKTAYEARLKIDGAQVTVDLPGTHRVLSDPRFSEWQGNFATFELFSNHGATDSVGAFEKIWATGSRG
ncbi:hypothetical protein [Mycobacterium servetii]|uniref:Uncharacterized protein n=1 Tax=Mycobacterium servetii TaxID=3237418 RepID=A0ABV4C296_9MYCO